MSVKKTQAQIEARRRQDEKRKLDDRLPGVRITKKESVTMNKIYKLFDSKKEAVLEAVEFYLKKNK